MKFKIIPLAKRFKSSSFYVKLLSRGGFVACLTTKNQELKIVKNTTFTLSKTLI